ncbi:MAG: glycosyltransferase family 4 protein [Geminocystis sp.]|nr:glycosyltransferase family 4 protein [Geminocystis sp.]
MRLLHISTFDILGGAARAAYRIHKSLQKIGVDSWMLVQNKNGDDPSVLGPKTKVKKFLNLFRPFIDQLPVKIYKNKSNILFSPSWLGLNDILSGIEELKPDIVHLHWVCGGYLRIGQITKIKQPIVWTLHDMWAFTGGCHYDENCNLYKTTCGHCKVLRSDKLKDLSHVGFKRKKRIYEEKKDLFVVGISRWISECAKSSSLLKDKVHLVIHNPIDIDLYKPIRKELAREIWNLPKDKKFILFGAESPTYDLRKGYKELTEALKKVKSSDTELVIFGRSSSQTPFDFGFKAHYVGYLSDDISLVTLYNCADVVVVPSLQENLSNTIMESLSCGVPVVAFDIGGNPDMIEHKTNGYLAKPYDTDDLASGIDWVLNDSDYNTLSLNARHKVISNFESICVANKYFKLYESILAQ